ncbi:hypothetical protein ACFUOZ_06085 [Paenarthrobacter sp. NPDC057355]|uniref:LEM-3-like GIY-YIG domain-containing protein n=1 Tax=Paenarthrobacter sp. NPDC057355 TaxID=3346105 RepID=UPI00363BC447
MSEYSKEIEDTSTARGVHYVYALVRTPGAFRMEDIFYIGKGKGLRSRAHFKEAQEAFRGTAKQALLRSILEMDDSLENIERHAYVLVGGLSEQDAFNVESALIKMLGGPMGPQLFNLQSGHSGQDVPQVVPLNEARIYFDALPQVVEKLPVASLADYEPMRAGRAVVVVKGTHLPIAEPMQESTGEQGPVPQSEIFRETEQLRNLRGWDPTNPWTDAEARERASVWWAISAQNVLALQALAADKQVLIALLVRDPRSGSSVVRYVWEIDPVGTWQFAGTQWGIPLGRAVEEHPWRGSKLLAPNNRQVLHGHSTGIGYVSEGSAP